MLVLSIFPGVGLFDRAFELEGFCVVRGPDLLWGGDVKQFHPPAGCFDGIIGGPPCQRFSRLQNLVRHCYPDRELPEDLIPEFERVVEEAQPAWFVMEEVPEAPLPVVPGYHVHAQLVADFWVGGATTRKRRFSFGTRVFDGTDPAEIATDAWRRLRIEQQILHRTEAPLPAVLASGGRWVPVAIGGSVEPKPSRKGGYLYGAKNRRSLAEAIAAQGLPADFDLHGMTVAAKIRAVGNGVPIALGRAIARAVRAAIERTNAGPPTGRA